MARASYHLDSFCEGSDLPQMTRQVAQTDKVTSAPDGSASVHCLCFFSPGSCDPRIGRKRDYPRDYSSMAQDVFHVVVINNFLIVYELKNRLKFA